MLYCGKNLTKREVQARVGHVSQLADARELYLASGKAEAVRAVEVQTGGGLQFTLLASRGLDIAWAAHNGRALAYIGKPGVVHPAYYDPQGAGFLRSFYAGLLTTCGLTFCGAAGRDGDEELGLHGRISHTPAEDLAIRREWRGDEYHISVQGTMREARVFGENLSLQREISVIGGQNRIFIHDRIENEGFTAQPLMLLYHCNFGFPLLGEKSRMLLSGKPRTRARDAAGDVERWAQFQAPTADYAEQVFYHDEEGGGLCLAALYNPEESLGAYVRFDRRELPRLIEWKMMGEGDYVLGIEPANCYPEGRAAERARGTLQWIKPGETRDFSLEIAVVESEAEIPWPQQ